jgi:hypothetical protein
VEGEGLEEIRIGLMNQILVERATGGDGHQDSNSARGQYRLKQ